MREEINFPKPGDLPFPPRTREQLERSIRLKKGLNLDAEEQAFADLRQMQMGEDREDRERNYTDKKFPKKKKR